MPVVPYAAQESWKRSLIIEPSGSPLELCLLVDAERRAVCVLPIGTEMERSGERAVGVQVECPPDGEVTRCGLPGIDGGSDEATGLEELALAV